MRAEAVVSSSATGTGIRMEVVRIFITSKKLTIHDHDSFSDFLEFLMIHDSNSILGDFGSFENTIEMFGKDLGTLQNLPRRPSNDSHDSGRSDE